MAERPRGEGKRGITRYPNVLPLSSAAFFNDTGADMLFAFYPLFFLMVLKEPRLRWFGLVETVSLFIGYIIRPFTGRLGDVRGRKPLICGGYFLLAVSRVLQGLARVWLHLLPAKAVYEIGRGMRNPPRAALLAESVPADRRGEAFGVLESMDTAGAIVGPLLGMGIFSLLAWLGLGVEARFRAIFFAAALPTLISVVVVALFAREVRRRGSVPEADPQVPPAAETLEPPSAANRRSFYVLTVACSLAALVAITEHMLLACGASIMRLKPQETLRAVFLYWLVNVSYAPSAILAGRFSDRTGRKPMVVGGLVALAVLTAFLPMAKGLAALAPIFLAHGIYQGLYKPVRTAFVADLAPLGLRGSWIGAFEMWTGVATIPAQFLFGLLWDVLGPVGVCSISAGVVFVSAILIGLFVREAA